MQAHSHKAHSAAHHGNAASSSAGGEMTALQRHISFFDKDGDGIVTPLDTWNGFRELGYGLILSFMGMSFIHVFMSWPSQDNWIPRSLNIHVKNANRCLHGSDSQVYTPEGEFSDEAFEKMWSRYDPNGKGFMDHWQIAKMLYRNRDVFDFFGWIAAALEWTFLWVLCADKNWRLHRETVRGQYDGTLFEKIRDQNKRGSGQAGSSSERKKRA